jgi:hypothetical protein
VGWQCPAAAYASRREQAVAGEGVYAKGNNKTDMFGGRDPSCADVFGCGRRNDDQFYDDGQELHRLA